MKYLVCLALLLSIEIHRAGADTPITAIAISPNRLEVVLGSQLGIELRTLPDLKVVSKLSTQLEHVHDLEFSPDGLSLLAAGGSPSEYGRLEVWNWTKREQTVEVVSHEDVVYRVAWSPDGMQWVTCGGDGRCQVFASVTGKRVTQYDGHSRGVLAGVYLDNHTIASVAIDQTIRLWNCFDGSHVRTLDNHVGSVNDIAVKPLSNNQTGDVIATVSEDRTVRLWQPRIGRLMRFVRLVPVPRCVAWSSDGAKLYVGCNDGQIRVIDVESVEVDEEIDGQVGRIHELAFDSAAGYFVTAGETGCRVVSLNSNLTKE